VPLHHGVGNAEVMVKLRRDQFIRRNSGRSYCNVHIKQNLSLLMARLLEGKAAAITGGVTGNVHPTTGITHKADMIPQALVEPLFSNMLVKVPVSE
jgi:hypothetical protein